jgi:hypothetical protein
VEVHLLLANALASAPDGGHFASVLSAGNCLPPERGAIVAVIAGRRLATFFLLSAIVYLMRRRLS